MERERRSQAEDARSGACCIVPGGAPCLDGARNKKGGLACCWMTRSGKRGLVVFPIFLQLATTKRSVFRSGPHKSRYKASRARFRPETTL